MDSSKKLNAESIKSWLAGQGRDRAWLAEQVGVKKNTVDNWLSRGKPIPAWKQEAIARMMFQRETSLRDVIAVSVRFTAEEMAALQAALPPGSDLEEVLRSRVLNEILAEARREVQDAIDSGGDADH